jgi:hypothetical protein
MPDLSVQGESTDVRPIKCDAGQYNEPRPDGEEPERLELGWVVVRSRHGRRVGSAERVAVRDSSLVVGGRTVSIEDGFGSPEGEAPPKYDAETEELLEQLDGESEVRCMAVTEQAVGASLIVMGDKGGTIKVWDSGACVSQNSLFPSAN